MKKIYPVKMIIVIACIFFVFAGRGFAKTYDECNVPAKAGLFTASFFLTLPYWVVKTTYAYAGLLVSGTVNALTLKYADTLAEKIAIKSTGGDWYITPRILLGEKKFEFSGSLE